MSLQLGLVPLLGSNSFIVWKQLTVRFVALLEENSFGSIVQRQQFTFRLGSEETNNLLVRFGSIVCRQQCAFWISFGSIFLY